jgi:hypothetical protein
MQRVYPSLTSENKKGYKTVLAEYYLAEFPRDVPFLCFRFLDFFVVDIVFSSPVFCNLLLFSRPDYFFSYLPYLVRMLYNVHTILSTHYSCYTMYTFCTMYMYVSRYPERERELNDAGCSYLKYIRFLELQF